jgi:NTE family protein
LDNRVTGVNIWRRQSGSDHVDDPTTGPRADDRISVGLALGGGAARGFAHIGVLRTLNAHGIRPEVIAGTSIGAVVGGFYAAGQLDAFEDWARRLTRRRMLGSHSRWPRSSATYRAQI